MSVSVAALNLTYVSVTVAALNLTYVSVSAAALNLTYVSVSVAALNLTYVSVSVAALKGVHDAEKDVDLYRPGLVLNNIDKLISCVSQV